MAFTRFLIAPFNNGLTRDLRPWLIPDDAFERLQNAYVFRGRVRKRFGSRFLNLEQPDNVQQLYSRLRVNLGETTMSPETFDFPGGINQVIPGQACSINDPVNGDIIITIVITGAGAATLSTGDAIPVTATIDTTVNPNTITITGATVGSTIWYYPSTPVMGFGVYERFLINEEPTYAFDTQFAYQRAGGGWQRAGDAIWTGDNADFFWSTTWRGANSNTDLFFASNYTTADPIRYWDNTSWTDYTPVLNATFRLRSSRIILPFKNRLLFLNTIENDEGTQIGTTDASGDFNTTVGGPPFAVGGAFLVGTNVFTITALTGAPVAMDVSGFPSTATNPNPAATGTFDSSGMGTVDITGNNENPNQPVFYLPNLFTSNTQTFRNRCRFTQNGSPLSGTAALDSVAGRGGFIDAATQEGIISAEFIKDRLIVFFERSTWELVYTGSEILPFRWQKINTELGAESTFSIVPFDKVVLGIANVGIHACSGANVERIDQKIPDEVFNIHNENDGVVRVHGIRDYTTELVYWTFPSASAPTDNNPTFPQRVLVYNYITGSWALNDDAITAFGYFQNTDDITWESLGDITWQDAIFAWDSGYLQGAFRNVIAGNQEGYTFLIDPLSSTNEFALQITAVSIVSAAQVELVVYNHTLTEEDYIYINHAVGLTSFNDTIYRVLEITSINTVIVDAAGVGGAYLGGGVISRVSRIDILTKQFNFFAQQGRQAFIKKVNFLVDRTSNGQITVDYFPSSSDLSMVTQGQATNAILGTSVLNTSAYTLIPLESLQDRLWHPVYFQTDGQVIQFRLYLSNEQMVNKNVRQSDFELHAMLIHARPTSTSLD